LKAEFSQGDLIQISGFKNLFLIVSKNAFIRAVHMFHICPVLKNIEEGPLHIQIAGINGSSGTAVCEQIKLIDPVQRGCIRKDRLSYAAMVNISDAIQGIFEYD